jgi:hypothetical protein
MKSLTIHNIDDNLHRLIRQKAAVQGTSMNKTIKAVLFKSFDMRQPQSKPIDNSKYFRQFLGAWNKRDYAEFQKATKSFETIDAEDWV